MDSQLPARIRPLLKGNAFLGRLPDAIIEALLRRGQTRRYAKGEFVFRRGDPGDSLMILITGSIKLTVINANAKELVLQFVSAGQVFGEIAALDGRERAAGAIALEDSEVFVIRTRDILSELAASPEAMLEIVRSLCDRARNRVGLFEDLTLDMPARFAKGLLRLARQVGRRRKDGIHLGLTVSQEELGNYLGLARSNVSRQLGRLKALDAIKLEGTRIVITDERALVELADRAASD